MKKRTKICSLGALALQCFNIRLIVETRGSEIKGGEDFFKKKRGRRIFTLGKIPKIRPGYLANFIRSLTDKPHFEYACLSPEY